MLQTVMRREVDVVCAWDVSRLGRSRQHLTMLLNDIHAKENVTAFVDMVYKTN
ncbi:recombinase family protein [Gammaproteobacteria bacterium]|nr:recombinase family protein [Gammaproteobacteria bacterium]